MEETDNTEVSYNNESLKDLNVIKTFKTTNILVFVGIIGCLLGFVGAAIVAAGKLRKDVGAALVLIAVILLLLAPLYIMFTLPSAFKEDTEDTGAILFAEGMFEDFFGSDIEEAMGMSMEVSWGGSIGWFLTIFAAIICIIALILVAISKPISAPTFQEMPTPLDMYAKPYDIVQPQQQAQFFADEETFPQYPSPLQIPRPQGEDFQCPNCNSIFILTFTKRPAIIRCPYCGLEGLVE